MTTNPTTIEREQLAAALRAWLTRPVHENHQDLASTVAADMGFDEHWPPDESSYFLGNVEEMVSDAVLQGGVLTDTYGGVGIWAVADSSGILDGFLITLDTPAGRLATLHHDLVELEPDDDTTGVDAAVHALLEVADIVAELRIQAGRIARVLSKVDAWETQRAELAAREGDTNVHADDWQDSDDRAVHLVRQLAMAIRGTES